MKLILTTAFILAAGTAFSATIQGCDVVDMGGYLNKSDPTCVFSEVLPGSRVIAEGTEGWFPDNLDGDVDTITVQDN